MTNTNTNTTHDDEQGDQGGAAEAEAQEATDQVAALEERIRDGDAKVTPDQLNKASGLARFARLRLEAARRKAEQRRAAKLEAERVQACAEARAILDEHPPAEVDAALAAAGEAMINLRAAARAHNACVDRAVKHLAASPVEGFVTPDFRTRGESLPEPPEVGYRHRDGELLLYIDRKVRPKVDERAVMDKARKHPAAVDHAEQTARSQAAEAKRIEADAQLYGTPEFNGWPAYRRKAAVDFLGISWDEHERQRGK